MQLNFSEFSATQRYHLMTQTIIPRPIAWALTDSSDSNDSKNASPLKETIKDTVENNDHSYNLAPFSYFTAVSSEPALLMISVGKKPDGSDKDTLANILTNKKVVIHIPSATQADLVTKTAATLAHGESELTATGLTTTPFANFSLPRLSQCDIAYGCELYEIKQLGDAQQTLIFVEVKALYINDDVLNKENPDRINIAADKVSPLARLGGGEYASITAPFSLQRPK